MSHVPPELAEKLSKRQVILFVGAGVSMSLKLPSYGALIREIGDHVGFDGEIFQGLGDYLTLAEYYHLKKKGLKDLQTYLRREWERDDKDILESQVHRAIVELDCDLIYTTNFDSFLERAHRGMNRPPQTIRSAKDLVNLKLDRPQIVKFHGDLTIPSAMVFTETSFFERLSFESPLDLKLRADALGKSLLFIGYSLSDINMRYLMFRLQRQWESESEPELRPKSYVFMGRPNLVQSTVLASRGVETIDAEFNDPAESLAAFLRALRSAAGELKSESSAGLKKK